jgi:ketosteroid isomerase-like protein
MGFRLRVLSDSLRILDLARAAYGGFGEEEPGETAGHSADFTFRLFEHAVDDGTLGEPVLRTEEETGLVYQSTGRDSTLVLDPRRGEAFGYFSPSTVAAGAFFRWHFLDLALFFMVEHRGFLGVHGAAVARGGKALLLRAASGQGKTTLTYAAARERWQALAEDIVWIAPDHRRWWGTPWTFHLLPDAPRLFPELAGRRPTVQLNGESKIAVSLEAHRRGSTTASATPSGIVLLRRDPGGRSRLEPIEGPAAWEEWLAGCASRERRQHADYDQRIEGLLEAPCYRLHFGDDIDHALDLLEPLLA